ncbi:hypothetical protein [Enterococcus villorum]|nr:hypothetical protein [Enterococcus villorum]
MMYTTAFFIILMGILFLCSTIYFFLDNYKKNIIGQENKAILFINIILLIFSMVLLILGIVYYIVVNQQL